MSWYEGIYSCGHEGRINIIGPTKDRQRKADWYFSNVCPECYKKYLKEERENKNKEAAEKSAEMELPKLIGTEKQVAWANSIRIEKINALMKKNEKIAEMLERKGLEKIPEENIGIKEISDATDYFIRVYTDAKWWIEHRRDDFILKEIIYLYKKHLDDVVNKDVIEEIKKEEESLTVLPNVDNRKKGIVRIKYYNFVLSAEYIRNDEFIDILKNLGYKWNGSVWTKNISEYTGNANDRIADLGNKLLLSGFTVQFPNIKSKEMAVSGIFTEENDRWVKYNTKIKKLTLTWKKRSDILYDNAKKLPGTMWENGSMNVSIEFYKEVLDFAETMGFSISKMAYEKIEKYKQVESKYDTAFVTVPNVNKLSDEERISKSLKSDRTIIEDLIDD